MAQDIALTANKQFIQYNALNCLVGSCNFRSVRRLFFVCADTLLQYSNCAVVGGKRIPKRITLLYDFSTVCMCLYFPVFLLLSYYVRRIAKRRVLTTMCMCSILCPAQFKLDLISLIRI